MRELVEEWLASGIDADSIAILSPRKFSSSVASKPLGASVTVKDRSGRSSKTDPGEIPFSTIHAFKGLESEAVILVDIEDIERDMYRGLLYIGASRARTMLAVLRSDATTKVFTSRLVDQGFKESAGVAGQQPEVF